MEYGNVQNGILGVIGGELNSRNSETFGVSETEGFYVKEVQENSGAMRSGIKKGDIIKSVNGIEIVKFSDLTGFLKTKSPNDVVEVGLLRDGENKVVKVTLEKRTIVDVSVIGTLRELESEDLKNHESDYGLELKSLFQNNKAEWEADGISEGDLIIEINNIKVNSVVDVQKALSSYSNKVYQLSILKKNGEKVAYRFR